MKIKTAVIGTGNMGKNHARIYSELKESEIIAVSDIRKTRGMEIAEKYGCDYYKNYKEMLKRKDIEAVSICVPTNLHYQVSKEVINKGFDVLVEKPIASSIKEAENMIKLAEKNGVKLMVGHVERFNPAIRKLKALIDKGKLGDVMSVVSRRVGLFPPNIKGSDVITDLAVHDIDVFNYILNGLPDSVYIKSGNGIIKSGKDYAGIFMTYGKTNAIIEVNWITPVKIRVMNVTGTSGYAELNYITQDVFVYETNYQKTYNKFGDFVVKFGKPKRKKIKIKRTEPLKIEIIEFLKCIKRGCEPPVSGMDGLNVLKIAKGVNIK